MILYTIYDPSVVFSNIDYYNFERSPSGFSEIEINGVTVLASRNGPDGVRLERILSTNPSHFLDPKLQPGVIVGKQGRI